jgi:hypothetical protein
VRRQRALYMMLETINQMSDDSACEPWSADHPGSAGINSATNAVS